MDNNIVNMNSLGEDSIKGGIFFGSSLTPAGTFSNTPRFMKAAEITQQEPSLMLTLQKIKDSLKDSLQQETGGAADDITIENFLYDFTGLLIDYRDLRNYVFYGSANTELAYNIRHIIENYPYSTLIGMPFGGNQINVTNYTVDGNEFTDVVFPEKFLSGPDVFTNVVLDNFNRFNFFDDDSTSDWTKYELVDKNGRRYPILKVTTPYKSDSIYSIESVQTVSKTVNTTVNRGGIVSVVANTFNTIRVEVSGSGTLYNVGAQIEFLDLKYDTVNNNIQAKELLYKIFVPNGTLTDTYYYNMNKAKFLIQDIIPKTVTNGGTTTVVGYYIDIQRAESAGKFEDLEIEDFGFANFYNAGSKGLVRLRPLSANYRPFHVKVNIKGRFSPDAFLSFEYANESKTGFMISPTQDVTNNWELQLTPVQNMLLSPAPVNPTPWPRRPITGNIMNLAEGNGAEEQFMAWLQSPTSMYVEEFGDEIDSAYGTDLYYEYRLVRALVLDETYSNQLIRRVVPHELISELNDTDDFYFQRFILVAGWFFDQIRVYVQFIKYAHTINHTEFDQLSPEYYRYYSDYYGLDLFNDDSIDFSKLVIQTEPGYYFVDSASQLNNKYLRNTLQTLQFERQKRLLLSLFYLYKIKGTQACIQQLISLLGAPEGFLALEEYAFAVNNRDNLGYPTNGYAGERVIDNDKVHTPKVSFEIDPDFLVDKVNIDNPVNKPYVYRQLLDNEHVYNLREVSVHTDPNGAIDNQIENIFGSQRYNYIKFNKGEFATLQNTDLGGEYFLLPLSIPDRFYGFSVDYMIPRNGFKKGTGTGTEEANVSLLSLYNVGQPQLKSPFTIQNVVLSSDQSAATITMTTALGGQIASGDQVFINGVNGIGNINNLMFVAQVIDEYSLQITGNFNNVYQGGGTLISGELTPFVNKTSAEDLNSIALVDYSLDYTYPLAVTFPVRNEFGDNSFAKDSHGNTVTDGYTNPSADFNLLQQRYPNSTYLDDPTNGAEPYIIIRLEGKDLVVRLRLKSEVQTTTLGAPVYEERVAIAQDFFRADGLNHSLRMVFREEGVEVYEDYEFVTLAKWINPASLSPYKAYEIPTTDIRNLANDSDSCFDYYEPIKVTDMVSRQPIANTSLDKINWWDLFMGMPNDIDIYFKKVSFFENNAVNDFDKGDRITDANNDTAEFYVFEVFNPMKGNSSELEFSNFSLPAVFDQKVPNIIPDYYGFALPQSLDSYNRNIITNLRLANQKVYNEVKNVLFTNRQQDFFKFSDLFKNNAWQKDIHSAYDYELFKGELEKLYTLYSSQVLTYNSLSEFLDLVEGKFKSVFEQFIPIVVNLLQFGRLVKNSEFNQAKFRLTGSDKECQGLFTSNHSFAYGVVFQTDGVLMDGLAEGSDIEWNLVTTDNQVIANTTTVPWNTTRTSTLEDLAVSVNMHPANHAGIWLAKLENGVFSITVDFDLFFANFSNNANNLVLTLWQTDTGAMVKYQLQYGNTSNQGAHPNVTNHCGDIIAYGYTDDDVCGYVKYSLPNTVEVPLYIYYETENQPAIYPRFASEINSDAIFVKKAGE